MLLTLQINLLLYQWRQYKTRTDRIACNPTLRILQRNNLRQSDNPMFGCNIRALINRSNQPMYGSHINNPPPLPLLHRRQGMLDRMETGTHVQGDDLIPVLVREFLDAVDMLDSGIIY